MNKKKTRRDYINLTLQWTSYPFNMTKARRLITIRAAMIAIIALLFGTPLFGTSSNMLIQLSPDNGLAHTDVAEMMEDSEGFMWLGTSAGLQCFDGHELFTYDYYNDFDQRVRGFSNRITQIEELNDYLIVGTKGGINIFDKTKRHYIDLAIDGSRSDVLKRSGIMDIALDANNNIWIRAKDCLFIASFDPQKNKLSIKRHYEEKINGDVIDDVINIYKANRGVWLVIHSSKIIHLAYQNDSLEVIKQYVTPSIVPNRRHISNSYYGHNILFLRYQDGIVGLNVSSWNGNINTEQPMKYLYPERYKQGLSHSGMIISASRNTLWCKSDNDILKIEDIWGEHPNITKINQKENRTANTLNHPPACLALDSHANLWISTWGGGVICVTTKEAQFGYIGHDPSEKQGINGTFVKAMARDKEGYLWIVSQNYGLEKYDFNSQHVIESYPAPTSILHNGILKSLMISDKSDEIYVGSADGLYSINRKSKQTRIIIGRSPQAEAMSESANIYDIDIDKNGNIWCATWDKGLIVLSERGGKLQPIHMISNKSQPIAISSNLITEVKCCDNTVWATSDAGINRLTIDDKSLITSNQIYAVDTTNAKTLNCNFISTIAIENDSTLWLGSIGGGVNRMILKQDGSYSATAITTKEGLASNEAEIIQIDNAGRIWVGGKGISRIEYPSINIVNFNRSNGLQSNTFKIGSSYKDEHGTLFFGGVNGLNYFNPLHIQKEINEGRLAITKVVINEKEQDSGITKAKVLENANYVDNITLERTQDHFSIFFSILNPRASNEIIYRYKLGDQNSSWIITSNKLNYASFSGLSPGEYSFLVEASYNSGITWDSSNGRKLTFKILAPWWWSTFSKIIYLLIILSIIYYLFMLYRERMAMRYRLALKDIEERQIEDNHQLKLQFFTNISHEFRTPLTIIISAIERLQTTISPEENQLANSISRNANKMLSLISQLMDFRKTETQRDKLRVTKEEVNPIMQEIIDEFTLWAEKKSIKLNYHQSEDISLWLDREKFAKITLNLISNALKYSTQGGEVNIELNRGEYKKITPQYKDEYRCEAQPEMGECMRLYVRDNGIGIIKESLPKLFERYFQIVSKTSLHLGSGIGLAVVKNMTLSHNSNIIVSSARNIGSEFIVAIPIDDSYLTDENKIETSKFDIQQYIDNEYIDIDLDEVAVEQPTQEYNDAKETILLVEDNVELLELLRKHFCVRYNVLTATNGEIGLQTALKQHPDLIISDVMMPKMSGTEMCRMIRENISTIHTPIILLTAMSEVQDQIEGLEAGADLYLPKPFTTRVLDLHVKRLLSFAEQIQSTDSSEPTNRSKKQSATLENQREIIAEQKDQEFLQSLTQLVLENIDNNSYTIELLCNHLAIGRTRLYSKIKSITGNSLGDYIREIRITKAAELLMTTDNNISEVMYMVGISSNSHFSKAFKQHHGMTPSEFIKQKSAQNYKLNT